MSTEHLFVYGSLLDPRTLTKALGHRHTGEQLAARLDGYRRITLQTYPYPFLVAAGGESVAGALLTDLTAADLAALDRYEEVDHEVYRREFVEVEVWGCGRRPLRVRAHTYVGGPGLTYTRPC